MKVNQIKKSLEVMFLVKDIVPCFVGERGIGKTQSLIEYGKENGYKVVVVHMSQFEDVGDLTGLPIPQKEEDSNQYYTVYAKSNIFDNSEGKPLFIILDEINQSKPHIRLAAFELVRHRRIGGNYLGDESKIVAACNPDNHDDYQVEFFQNAAWEDSFCWIKTSYDHNAFLEYCNDKEFFKDSKMLFFISQDSHFLREAYKEDFEVDFVKPSARSVEKAAELYKVFHDSNLNDDYSEVFDEVMSGLISKEMYFSLKGFNDQVPLNAEYVLNTSQKDLEKYLKFTQSVQYLVHKNIVQLLEDRYLNYNKEEKDLLSEKEAQNYLFLIKNTENKDLVAGFLKQFLIQKTFQEKNIPNFKKYLLDNDNLVSEMLKTHRDRKD